MSRIVLNAVVPSNSSTYKKQRFVNMRKLKSDE